ncbi:hypothetical protein PVAP13_3KG383400 [Panicum virgatum]|uniref:Secreted protein n=1 Tax=Panicum virgatum TaxID=38727 RepID=A0A8T0V3B2_PANVG|nr:hypothetical protein PVAP13_3KG383400 [Panicum virgatum]
MVFFFLSFSSLMNHWNQAFTVALLNEQICTRAGAVSPSPSMHWACRSRGMPEQYYAAHANLPGGFVRVWLVTPLMDASLSERSLWRFSTDLLR